MTDEFVPYGKWWTWPLWRRGLAMMTLRPALIVCGYLAMARQWYALRQPNRPFHPLAWVHREPCDMEWCRGHDEVHHGLDGCGFIGSVDHALEYERHLETAKDLVDDFDVRVGRTYIWTHQP